MKGTCCAGPPGVCGAVVDAPPVAQDDHALLGAGHCRVKQIAVVHEGMRLVGDDHGAGELRALHFVDRRGVCQLHVAQRIGTGFDLHRAAIEVDHETAVGASIDHDAHRAVHHAQLVVVLRLDHLVARIEAGRGGQPRRQAPRRRTASAATGAATRYSTPPCRAGLCASA